MRPQEPRTRWSLRQLVVALAVVGLVVLGLLSRFQGPDGVSPVALARALTSRGGLDAALEPDWFERRPAPVSGIATDASPATELAFQLGVESLDLEIALRTRRLMAAAVLARRLTGALEAGESELAELGSRYEDLRRGIESGAVAKAVASSGRLSRRLAELAVSDPALDRLGLTFGWWCEAGRLAGLSSQVELLTSPAFRQFLPELDARDDWHPRVAIELERLRDLLQPELNDLQVAAITVSFEAIVARSWSDSPSRPGSTAWVPRDRRTH